MIHNLKFNRTKILLSSIFKRKFGSRTENPGYPKELQFSSNNIENLNISEVVLNKKIEKYRKFLRNDVDNEPAALLSINQSFLFDHFELLDSLVYKMKREDSKKKLLALATGYKQSQKNIKSNNYFTIEMFDKAKMEILKARPHLEKFDVEKYFKVCSEEEKIEYIKDSLKYKFPWSEYDLYNTPDDNGDKIMMLIKDIRMRLITSSAGEEDHVSDVIKDNEKFNEESLSKMKQLLQNQDPSIYSSKEISDDDCIRVLQLFNSQINYFQAYFDNKVHHFEERVALYRFNAEFDYMTRGDTGVFDFDVIHKFRENEIILKNAVEISYKPEFKKSIKSYAKSIDNKRIDIGMILNRPPIFLDLPKNEIEFLIYKNNFLKKYNVNIEPMLEELESHNSNQNELWKMSEKVLEDDPNNEPIIRKPRSKNSLSHLELKKQGENNFNYMNSYLLKDNSPDDPYDVYCLNSKHYLRVDPNIKDPKDIQTDSCWDVYYICLNKHTKRWEFPTKSVLNGHSLRDTVQWLIYDITKKDFSIFFPREYHPLCMIERNFFKYEEKEENNSDLFGVRTYYFMTHHDIGAPTIFINSLHPYEDFLMVKKDELRNYFDKEYYEAVVKYLH